MRFRPWPMALFSALICVVVSTVPAIGDEEKSTRGRPSDGDGFVPIFDGQTLDGWHAVPKESASDWSVRDGAIVGHGSADRLAYLVWKDERLTDFELELRYRLPGKGNTGVEIRSQPDLTGKRPFEGYHADLGHVGIGPHILGAWDFHFATRKEHPCSRGTRLVIDEKGKAHSRSIDGALTVADIRPRQWNDVRIIARGRNFQFFVNDKLASEFTDNSRSGRLDHGAIGLQIHDEGMRVEFKDIRLKRLTSGAADAGDMNRTSTMYAPHVEWSLSNANHSGNPFDLVATATFTHGASGETHATEMFYAGKGVWKFRFTGTRTGAWTFATSSADPDLAGKSGAVTIAPNPNPEIHGFLTSHGNKYAVQSGDDASLEAYRFNVFMSRAEFPAYLSDMKDLGEVDAYLADARKHGFEIIFVHVCNSWFKSGARSYSEHRSTDPDLAALALLETIITRVHAQGGRVHLWAWGDESRKWTPIGVGGINGAPDERLQRYIAARLGPLPGWTMGYGFDLHEWTRPAQLNEWAAYMRSRLGWKHLLCARGENAAKLDVNSYDGFGRNVPLKTTNGGPRDFAEVAADIDGDKARPHLYEERHTYKRREFDLDMEGTRRLLWWQTMAGGVGGFYGYYPKDSSAYAGHPYPNPEQLRAVRDFWKGRFLLNMVRAPELSTDKDTRVLRSGSDKLVFYREDASSIQMNLSGLSSRQKAVAVDAKKAYVEIDLGTLAARSQTVKLPYSSDWAVAVGGFE